MTGPEVPQNGERPVRKVSLAERAVTPDAKQKLEDLTILASFLSRRIFDAYGSTPSPAQRREAAGYVIEDLISVAKDAREFARQYRNFNVGAAVLGLRKTERPDENPWVVMFDANTKASAEDHKWCAEQYLMDRAENGPEALEKILAFVVVAQPQTDDDSKTTQITLTPCKLCRDRMTSLMEEERPKVTPETQIITAHAENTMFRKVFPLSRLLVFHREWSPLEEID